MPAGVLDILDMLQLLRIHARAWLLDVEIDDTAHPALVEHHTNSMFSEFVSKIYLRKGSTRSRVHIVAQPV